MSDATARIDADPTIAYDLTTPDDDPMAAQAEIAAKADIDLDELYSSRRAGSLVHRPGDVGHEYVQFALNPQGRVPFGYEWIDGVLRGGIAPGEVATLAAGSGNGKTNFFCNLAVNNAHLPVLFVSIEMPCFLIAARLFAITERETYRTLEERLKAGSDNLQRRIERGLQQSLPNLGLMGIGSPTIEILEKAVAEFEEGWGQPPKLIMVDYLDLYGKHSENVENVKAKYVELRTFAKAHELGVVVAHQLRRDVLEHRNGAPLRLTDVRYAGESESDHFVAIYRMVNALWVKEQPALHAEHRYTIHCQILKNRSGEPAGELEGHELGWDPDTLKISDRADGLEPLPLGPTGAMRTLTTPGLFDAS